MHHTAAIGVGQQAAQTEAAHVYDSAMTMCAPPLFGGATMGQSTGHGPSMVYGGSLALHVHCVHGVRYY